LLALVAACSSEAPEGRGGEAQPAVQVIAAPVTLVRVADRVEAVGTARAQQAATLFPETEGEVTRIAFAAGDRVTAGTVLATLEDAEERLAEARARVTLQEAQQLLARYERIDVPGAVSESQIDAARTAVEAARIELDLAREGLAARRVLAPFEGYVGIPQVDPGQRVTPQTMITQLDARDMLFVDFEAPEEVFDRVQEGETLRLIPFSGGAPVEATVSSVGARIDPQRRLFTVRTALDNGSDRFRPGMSFRVTFETPGAAYPLVPEAAISWGGDGPYLWAVEDGTARRLPVTIVSRRAGEVFVDAPLEEGDLIVAEGVQKMREGTPVKTIGNPAPRPGGGGDRSSAQGAAGGSQP
jgi:RND family efflux transporter MFP subunit